MPPLLRVKKCGIHWAAKILVTVGLAVGRRAGIYARRCVTGGNGNDKTLALSAAALVHKLARIICRQPEDRVPV